MKDSIRSCWMVADDLSGAADCAAAFARVAGPVPVYLGGWPRNLAAASRPPCIGMDSDSRAMSPAAAAAATTQAFEAVARHHRPRELVYQKIDSTLRGHIALELDAALRTLPQLAGAVVAPAFPQQGRTLVAGRLHVHGRPAGDVSGDLLAMLENAALRPALLAPQRDPAAFVQRILEALAAGARAVVIDASEPQDLESIAAALCVPAAPQLLVAGSAGLARAVAAHLEPSPTAPVGADAAASGPVLAIVGSFARASAAQVQEIERSGQARVIRFTAAQWIGAEHAVARDAALNAARELLRDGSNVLFAIGGEIVQPFSRSVVRALARATAPLMRSAALAVLTGGDTARAMLEELGIERLDVAGEFETGIALGRVGLAGAPRLVLKSGGFGDPGTLQRIVRQFGRPTGQPAIGQLAPS